MICTSSVALMLFTGLRRYFGRTHTRGEGPFGWAGRGRPRRPVAELHAGCDAHPPAAVPRLRPVPLVPAESAGPWGRALPQPVSVLLPDGGLSRDTRLPPDGYGALLLFTSWEIRMSHVIAASGTVKTATSLFLLSSN